MGSISRLITAQNGNEFRVLGLKFRYVNSDFHLHKTNEHEIVILKPAPFLSLYEPIFERAPTNNVLEFGVFEGGSILLFALAYPGFKFVGVDIRPPSDDVLRYVRDLRLQDRVKLYYNTSQTDREQINRITKDEFGGSEIAIISDDASHNYRFSRSTFELTFDKLAPGGSYCIEDWGWAHWGEPYQTEKWADQPALSNLIFELLMMHASTHNVIDSIEVRSALACFRRGTAKLGEFQIDQIVRMRGRKLTLI